MDGFLSELRKDVGVVSGYVKKVMTQPSEERQLLDAAVRIWGIAHTIYAAFNPPPLAQAAPVVGK